MLACRNMPVRSGWTAVTLFAWSFIRNYFAVCSLLFRSEASIRLCARTLKKCYFRVTLELRPVASGGTVLLSDDPRFEHLYVRSFGFAARGWRLDARSAFILRNRERSCRRPGFFGGVFHGDLPADLLIQGEVRYQLLQVFRLFRQRLAGGAGV